MEQLIIEFAKDIVSNNILLSYLFFFVSQALQILFPPYPGDMVLIIEGYLTEFSNINLFLVMITAILATSLSSILLYNIGRKEGSVILKSKVVKYLFDTEKVNKLRHLFDRFGTLVIIGSKLIPGIFSLTVLSAGIFKVKRKLAYISIVIITIIHHGILIILGKILGENWTLIFYKINQYNRTIIVLAIIGFILYIILLKIKNKLFN
ncbi:MAG: hypothetical protein FH751_13185 [Firmicutes bacterium]|nr:hypothetical protein [Bacillota bacterium]